MLEPTLVGSETLYSSPYTTLIRDNIVMPNGIHTVREIVTRPDAVVIIPVMRDGSFKMVRQHRWAVKTNLLEFPAGKIENGMTPMDTAFKELKEEIGYAAGHIDLLGTFFASPGYSTERIYAYRAINLMPEKEQGDDDEDIEVETLYFDQIRTHIQSGIISDAKSISAFFLFGMRKDFYSV